MTETLKQRLKRNHYDWLDKNKDKWKKYMREYSTKNRDKIKINIIESFMKRYGSNLETYNKLLNEQGGACKICGKKESNLKGRKVLCIDHCHKSNLFRGLICFKCNIALGSVNDDIGRLKNMILYLEEFKKKVGTNY